MVAATAAAQVPVAVELTKQVKGTMTAQVSAAQEEHQTYSPVHLASTLAVAVEETQALLWEAVAVLAVAVTVAAAALMLTQELTGSAVEAAERKTTAVLQGLAAQES